VAGPKTALTVRGPRFTRTAQSTVTANAASVRPSIPRTEFRSSGTRSATKVTRAATLTAKVRENSITVMAALMRAAQPPNSSSLSPVPPLPSVTHRMTRRYMTETTTIVVTASQIEAPKVSGATPVPTSRARNGPKT